MLLTVMAFTLLALAACVAVTRWAARRLGIDPVETACWFGLLEVEPQRIAGSDARPAAEHERPSRQSRGLDAGAPRRGAARR